jgi:hypothetical protein
MRPGLLVMGHKDDAGYYSKSSVIIIPILPPNNVSACIDVGGPLIDPATPQQVPACMGVYTIDIAVRGASNLEKLAARIGQPAYQICVPLAIECDGPHHYVPSGGGLKTPATLQKARLLEQQGWRVVSIPFFEWPRKSAERGGYLENVLRGAISTKS